MKTLNDYAYTSKLFNVSPKQKIIFCLILLLLTLFLNSLLVSSFVVIMNLLVIIKTTNLKVLGYLKLLLIPISFLILAIIPLIVNIDMSGQIKEYLVGVNIYQVSFKITKSGVFEAMLLFVKSLACVSSMYFLSLTTTVADIISALKSLKIPTFILTLTELIYRYIYVLIEEANKIKIAQQSRLGYKNFKTSMTSMGKLIAMLFIRTYNKTNRVYNALISRGYNGTIVAVDKKFVTDKKLNIILILAVTLMILLAILEKKVLF